MVLMEDGATQRYLHLHFARRNSGRPDVAEAPSLTAVAQEENVPTSETALALVSTGDLCTVDSMLPVRASVLGSDSAAWIVQVAKSAMETKGAEVSHMGQRDDPGRDMSWLCQGYVREAGTWPAVSRYMGRVQPELARRAEELRDSLTVLKDSLSTVRSEQLRSGQASQLVETEATWNHVSLFWEWLDLTSQTNVMYGPLLGYVSPSVTPF